ncbi:hypothetical protein [Sandarakinorhabdus sp.]|uniref:hypothetical protein n=1 Tax=Sandarakinorhabdus sp. TaxID=1916663 RepID=UPI003F7020E6
MPNRPAIIVIGASAGGVDALGSLTQFSCHIGHVYTAEVMLAAQFLTMERFIEQALRALHERAELCRQEAGKYHGTASTHAASQRWRDAQAEAMEQSEQLQSLLQRAWIHPELAPPPLPSTHP